MVFSDILFIYVFLPLCFLMYFVCGNIHYRNGILLLFSLCFYTWGEPVWVSLLLLTAILDYNHGKYIGRHQGSYQAKARLLLSISTNLGLIIIFKYSTFLGNNLVALLGLDLPVPEIRLPIGISFFIFQSITYVVDVYRGRVQPQESFWKYLLYLAMFFQLVAGPIVRYATIAKELDHRETSMENFRRGLSRIIYGLAKKVIIANTVGEIAENLLTQAGGLNGSVATAWCGVFMYALQIYYDFSGYSDMAIGMGLACGFHFPENFNYPYISKSVGEFWRRWHISLGTFFRDYVYIPLGGNKHHQILNIAIVWALTGLWHGASWNFLLWGLYFGVLLLAEKYLWGNFLEKIPGLLSHIYLLFIALVGWAIFYYTDTTELFNCLKMMFFMAEAPLYDQLTSSVLSNHIYLILLAVVISTPISRYLEAGSQVLAQKNALSMVSITTLVTLFQMALLVISTLLLVGQTYNPVIYYRF